MLLVLHIILRLLDADPKHSNSSRTRGVEELSDVVVGLFRPVVDALGINPPPSGSAGLDLRAVFVLFALTAIEVAILLGIRWLDRRPGGPTRRGVRNG
jgi:hypothetical protein